MRQDLALLEARKDGIYLSLNPEHECPSLPILLQFLGSKGVLKFDEKAVEAFVRNNGSSTVKIGERHPEYEHDYSISVSISKDYMEASISITPPFFSKPWPNLEQVKSALGDKRITYGIDESRIENVLSEFIYGENVAVAFGLHPIAGKDGWVEKKIDPTVRIDKSETEEKIDHRERGTVINVSKGDVLAVRFPPTEGTDGVNVANIPVKAKPGKEAPFLNGAGTVISDDGATLLADVDGCLRITDGKLIVSPELNIKGDVDYHTGNINFVGSVNIRGAVNDGFQVLSVGDIEVFEMVEGALLESKGNIVVRGGVRGMNKAKIIAGGNIELGFVDQAEILGSADVYVRNAILHSEVSAGGSVIVGGGTKPQIVGGKIQAGIGVSCTTLGSEMGTKTEVIVGISPVHAERRKELNALIAGYKENLEKLDANIAFLKKLEADGSLDDNKRASLAATTKMRFQIQSQLNAAAKEVAEIEQMLEFTKSQGIVRVKGVCYPGTSISIRGFTYLIKEPFKFCSFVYEAGEVKLRSYDYNMKTTASAKSDKSDKSEGGGD